MSIIRKHAVALGVAGAVALGSVVSTVPALAGPVPSNTAALKQAVPSDVIDVRHRRGAWVAGAALGIIGLGLAAAARDRYYDDYYAYGHEPYAYGPYAYDAPYAYAPAYRYRAYPYSNPYACPPNGGIC